MTKILQIAQYKQQIKDRDLEEELDDDDLDN